MKVEGHRRKEEFRRGSVAVVKILFFLLFLGVSAVCPAMGRAAVTTNTAPPSFGQPSGKPPNEDAYLYREVPNIAIHTLQGDTTLETLWKQEPLLVTMVFTRCANACSPYLMSLAQAAQSVDPAGIDYRILVLSFDPRDTLDDLRAMAAEMHLTSHAGWIFAVASQVDIQRLATSFGFWYRWDPAAFQYDHPSMLLGVDKGRIARLLVGAGVAPDRLQDVVEELQGRFVASYPLPGSNVVFRCFAYDPSGKVHFSWGFLLLMLPGTLAIGAALTTFRVFSRT